MKELSKRQKMILQLSAITVSAILFFAATVLYFTSRPEKSREFYEGQLEFQRLQALEEALSDAVRVERGTVTLLNFNEIKIGEGGEVLALNFNVLIRKDKEASLLQIEKVGDRCVYMPLENANVTAEGTELRKYLAAFARFPLAHMRKKTEGAGVIELKVTNRLVKNSNRTKNVYAVNLEGAVEESAIPDDGSQYVETIAIPQFEGVWDTDKILAYYILT